MVEREHRCALFPQFCFCFLAGCGSVRVVSKPPPWQPRPLSGPVVAVVGFQSADTLLQQLDAMLRSYRVVPVRRKFARFRRRAAEPFITSRFIGWRPSRPVVANLSVATLKRIYEREIQWRYGGR